MLLVCHTHDRCNSTVVSAATRIVPFPGRVSSSRREFPRKASQTTSHIVGSTAGMFVSGALSVLSTAAPRSIRYGPGAIRARQSLVSRPHSMARLRLRTDVLSKQTSIVTKCFASMKRRQSRSTSFRVPSHLESCVSRDAMRCPPSPTRSLRQPESACESCRSTLPH